ncbi:MAG: hypothetical protein FWC16_09675 [Defluviitaleaceae bacterium]|nr:hypothetical protein [Defluviitaleaceae bacterium]MCL2275182.1 hypothetical protein [Defluviitaleaceae bacterium]
MKIFVAGPRAITALGKMVEDRLYNIYEKKHTIIVGDANGIDKAVQMYFSTLAYPHVTVYSSNGKVRNNLGNWQVESVSVANNVKGFDFYAMKDKAMADTADYGFMIWNGESKGTLNNIINLLNNNKKSLVYFTPQNDFVCVDDFEKLNALVNYCNDGTKSLLKKLCKAIPAMQLQMTLV